MQKVSVVRAPTWRATISAYVNLMKPHVTVLLLGTTLAAMTVAAGGMPPFGLVVATMLGGLMAAGSANCINCYWDRDIDLIMSRTRNRTLPAHRIPETHALIFGLGLGISSFALFALFVNPLSAALAVSAILFYILVYTMWLKRTTPQNIVIGGAAGAVPVLIGWAAVTNSISLSAIWMFLIIFLWTPPHFWALSLLLKKDYERAGVPMLPVVVGEAETYRQILLYSLLLLAATLVLFATQAMGYLYLAVAVMLGAGMLLLSIRLLRERTLSSARTLFWFSNYYLALLFAAMVIDRVVRS
ncbi:MAG: protoheme IX farnesyltransferase [Ktedonobacterales bacterium]|nr:protoheme IX farnesyltransferase [Ktedonobacterales bacterium]